MVKRFTTVTTSQAKGTLARKFIPLADSLRDLLTKFGLRSYRVSFVRVSWSSGRRGIGTPTVIEEKVILPTPKISSLDAVSELLQPIGLSEVGSIQLSGISGTYTEEQLLGQSPEGDDIPPDQEFFYEIEFFPNAGEAKKRRFTPKSVPSYLAGKLQWIIALEKANDDRARNGDPEG